MSIAVYEKSGSPRARFVNPTANSGSSIEFAYIVLGTASEIDAVNAALAVAPLAYLANSETLVRQEATPTPTGPTSWEVAIRFGGEDERKSQEPPQPGTWHFQFDSSGGFHRVTQSLETLWRGERHHLQIRRLGESRGYRGGRHHRAQQGRLGLPVGAVREDRRERTGAPGARACVRREDLRTVRVRHTVRIRISEPPDVEP